MSWGVGWTVAIDGQDVSRAMAPFLTLIEVVDRAETASDSCRLTFDDTGGQCLLPRKGASVRLSFNGVVVFSGVVDSTPWRLSRGGGRLLEVVAKGVDTRGLAKEGQLWHLDDASLGDVLRKAGQAAGIGRVVVDPALAGIVRDYWSPDGASFLAWGERLAREFGATFKIRDGAAVFAQRGKGLSAVGGAMPTVRGRVGLGGNVISVDIDPTKGRGQYRRRRVRYFDRAKAEFRERIVDVEGDPLAIATDTQRWSAADDGQAESMAAGQRTDGERDAGVGRVELDLAVEAQAEGTFILSGARSGIDGTYRITGVIHSAGRSGGTLTSLDLAQPQGGAGLDARVPSTSGTVPIPTPAPR